MAIMKKKLDYFIQTRDVDQNDIIKPAPILDIFQDIAGLHAVEIGVGYFDFKKKNLAWVVLYQKFEILSIPPYSEYVEVHTWPKPKGRLDFEREYTIETKNGKLLVRGVSLWVVMDLNTRSLVRADHIEYNGEYYPYTNYAEKTKRKLKLDPTLIEDYFTYIVSLDDLDHNGHMNNARYLNIVYNHADLAFQKKYIQTVEIGYIKEAKLNDIIRIGHYKQDSHEAFIGYISDELCFECWIGEKEL